MKTKGVPTGARFSTNGKWNPLYKAWIHMRQRCDNPTDAAYQRYGERGIRVCERWRLYDDFAADMGPHPGNGLTLDRIDNNKGYEPGNCRWATKLVQRRNSRQAKLTKVRADEMRADRARGMLQRELVEKYGVSKGTVHYVLKGETWR